MTASRFASLVTLLTGWVFAHRRTITRMIQAAGETASKHFSSDHRLAPARQFAPFKYRNATATPVANAV